MTGDREIPQLREERFEELMVRTNGAFIESEPMLSESYASRRDLSPVRPQRRMI
ncbi:hypothetical protein SCHPADRAFT_907881 [Schizopora paradoxa]|uniref:Uncharacterized protein n=1 Tax=Schizopora paradoxa TaxID=27342 RepID=A0A0H2RWV9_9AGAM|nr:hypothetical protein SCHPADRAFT_907881 [Schizopora paradoxa]